MTIREIQFRVNHYLRVDLPDHTHSSEQLAEIVDTKAKEEFPDQECEWDYLHKDYPIASEISPNPPNHFYHEGYGHKWLVSRSLILRSDCPRPIAIGDPWEVRPLVPPLVETKELYCRPFDGWVSKVFKPIVDAVGVKILEASPHYLVFAFKDGELIAVLPKAKEDYNTIKVGGDRDG